MFIIISDWGRRPEGGQGFSNASPNLAVMTHMWKCDIIGAPVLHSPCPTCIFVFNQLNRHAQQEHCDCQPQTKQRGLVQTSLWGMHHLHQPCRWCLLCKTVQAKPGMTSLTLWMSTTNPHSPTHINHSTRLEHDWRWQCLPVSPTWPVFGSSSTASHPQLLQSCYLQPHRPSRMYDLSWAILWNAYKRHRVW